MFLDPCIYIKGIIVIVQFSLIRSILDSERITHTSEKFLQREGCYGSMIRDNLAEQ